MRKITPILGILVTVLVVILAMGSPCFSAEDVIHGCYKKINGQLRIVNDQTECNASEVLIFWNQEGSRGPAGPAGLDGSLDLSKLYTKTCSNNPITHYGEASNECFCSTGDVALSVAVSCYIEDTYNQWCYGDTCVPYVYVGFPTLLTYEESEETPGETISGYKAQCIYINSPPEGYSTGNFPGRIDLRCAKP